MEKPYWDLFMATGDPEMYMKFKEGEKGDGTAEDDRGGPTDNPCQKQ